VFMCIRVGWGESETQCPPPLPPKILSPGRSVKTTRVLPDCMALPQRAPRPSRHVEINISQTCPKISIYGKELIQHPMFSLVPSSIWAICCSPGHKVQHKICQCGQTAQHTHTHTLDVVKD